MKTIKNRDALLIGAVVTFSSLILGGCAMEQKGNHLHFRTDLAEFAPVVGQFQLADGSEGKLRRDFTGQYSIKLSKYLKVIPLGKSPGAARIVYSGQVGHQTAVLIETSSNQCKYGYQLYAFVGKDVRAWDVGNCTVPARVFAEEGGLIMDFEQGANVRRYTFADNRLRSANFPASAARPMEARTVDSAQGGGQTGQDTNQAPQGEVRPGTPKAPDAQKGRHIPSPPIASATSSSAPVEKAPPAPSLSKNKQAKSKNPPPVIPDLVFGVREEKPTRVIVLTD